MPFMQTVVWQALGGGPQFASVMQPTQEPMPLHIRLVPQLTPLATFGFDGVPFVQTSSVHRLPSTGTSLSSTACTMLPLMQTSVWQLPVGAALTNLPSAAGVDPQAPAALHVNVRQ